MKTFLTGITGYIGHNLALRLADDGMVVHGLVRDPESKRIPKHPNIRIYKGNICDYDSVKAAISGCQYAFHTAAFTDLKCQDVKAFYCNNVTGTKTVMEACVQEAVKKVVYTSTHSVYGRALNGIPITENQPRVDSYGNDYELTKSISEDVIKDYVKNGLNCVILNLTRVFGPGLKTYSNGVNRMIERIMNGRLTVVPDRLYKKANYVFIDDVINAHIWAAQKGIKGERYIIGGTNLDYNELFKEIQESCEKPARIFTLNYGVMKYGIMTFEFLNRLIGINPAVNLKIMKSLFTERPASSAKAIKELGYSITPIKEGLQVTVMHLKKRRYEI